MQTMLRSRGRKGFTLVELLVALAIFAIIAVAGSALLGFSIDAQRESHVLEFAQEAGLLVAPGQGDVGGGRTPAPFRPVHDVVVHQGEGVEQLDRGGHLQHAVVVRGAGGAVAPVGEGGP